MTAWAKLQQKINYVFKDRSLLQQAITHKSANKNHYEKMEFLGDSALNFYIGYLLYTEHPDMTEGNLSIARSKLVNKNMLAAIGQEIDIDAFIRVDKNQVISQSIRADVIEAIIGAAFLDGGVSASELIDAMSKHKVKYDKIRLANCIPETNVELIQDKTYILEAGFERLSGVSFTKGYICKFFT